MSTTPSPADRMRYEMAKHYLNEAKRTRLVEAPPATLVMMVERLEHAVEDLVALLENCWSEPD